MKNSVVLQKKDSVKEKKVVAKAVVKEMAKEVAVEREQEKMKKEKKVEEVKKVEEPKKVTTAKKEEVKKEKESKKVNEEVYVQYFNQEVSTVSVVEKVKAAYIAEGNSADSIEKVRAYIKPEENMIYYVINDEYASGVSLF